MTGAHYGYGPMSGCTFRPPPVGRLNSPPISAHQMAANQITSSGHMTFPTTRSTINASPYGYVTPPSVAVYNRQQPTDMVTQYGRPQQQQLLMLKQQPITAVPNNRTWPSPIVERDELGAPATSKCWHCYHYYYLHSLHLDLFKSDAYFLWTATTHMIQKVTLKVTTRARLGSLFCLACASRWGVQFQAAASASCSLTVYKRRLPNFGLNLAEVL